MPTTTMITTAASVVFRLSQSASSDAWLPRLSIRSAGGVFAKIAITGRIRKVSASASATTITTTNGPRFLIAQPAGGGPKPASFSAAAPSPSSRPSMNAWAPSGFAAPSTTAAP